MPWSTASSDDAQAASTVYAGPRKLSRLATREAVRLGTSPMAPSGEWLPRRESNASRTLSSWSSASSGSSSRSTPMTWVDIRIRWLYRDTAGLSEPPRPRMTPIRSASGIRAPPPASAIAAAATSKAMSWSGSISPTEAGIMPNFSGSNVTRSSTNPPRRQ
jgi:hypothetical protein